MGINGRGSLLAWLLAGVCIFSAGNATAALYTNDYGDLLPNVSDCDDCSDGPVSFGGGRTLNFFGTEYDGLYVGSNGYVTFGLGASSFTSQPLAEQTIAPMIAGLFTDLDTRNDAASSIYANTATPGQIIISFVGLGHYLQNYSVRSTFQLVIRSDDFAVPAGEGRIGFFYDSVTDTANASAGFGDGLEAVNPGEVGFHFGPANQLSNAAPRWFSLQGGVPIDSDAFVRSVPTLSVWSMLLLVLGIALLGRRKLALR